MTLYVGIAAAVVIITAVVWLLSGRKKDEVWRELAGEVGGHFVEGGLFRASRVEVPVGTATVTLDTYSVPSGDSSTTYTRLRAAIQNSAGLHFNIRRQGLIARIDKALGMQDIDVGDATFDDQFIVQGQPVAEIQRLLSSIGLRQMLLAQKSITLFAKGNDLRLEAMGVVRDVERLRSMFELFKVTLLEVQSATQYQDAPAGR